MPNGKPGDDWCTDVVVHGLPTFSEGADRLIAEIAASSGEPRPAALVALVDRPLAEIGYEELASRASTVGMEDRNLHDTEVRVLEEELRRVRDERRDT